MISYVCCFSCVVSLQVTISLRLNPRYEVAEILEMIDMSAPFSAWLPWPWPGAFQHLLDMLCDAFVELDGSSIDLFRSFGSLGCFFGSPRKPGLSLGGRLVSEAGEQKQRSL